MVRAGRWSVLAVLLGSVLAAGSRSNVGALGFVKTVGLRRGFRKSAGLLFSGAVGR